MSDEPYDVFIAKLSGELFPHCVFKHAAGNFDADGSDELVVDFGSAGAYMWNGGSWTQISAANSENLISGDIDGDGAQEIFGDFGSLGLWMWDSGTWSQLSPSNPD